MTGAVGRAPLSGEKLPSLLYHLPHGEGCRSSRLSQNLSFSKDCASVCSGYISRFILFYPDLPFLLIPHLPGGQNRTKQRVIVSRHCLKELLLELRFPNTSYIECLKHGYFHSSPRKDTLLLPLFSEALRMVQGLALIPSVNPKSLQLLRP